MVCKKYAKVCQGSVVFDHSIDFLPDAKDLSIDKSKFAYILSEAAWSHNCSVQASGST